MNHLWAPWRMPFIEGSEPPTGCLFCTKLQEDADERNFIVHRGSLCFVMMNLYPYNNGHLMIVPYQHAGYLTDIPPETGTALFTTSQTTMQALDEIMHPQGYNLGINQGAVSGAGVADHLHLHVVPRWNGDTNFMPVLAGTKVMPELIATTATKLRPVLARLGDRAS
jgi:ATP adenylyltransferase